MSNAQKKTEQAKVEAMLSKKKILAQQKVKQWRHAAKLVAGNSHVVNKEFQAHSRIKDVKRGHN